MKILPALFSLLAMQIAGANEAVFMKSKEGCSAMLEVITAVDSVSWSGKCVAGKFEGVGIATYTNGNNKISFIEEYMEGVRAYPYAVDQSGAIRLSGGPDTTYIKMSTCQKLDECTALYDYAVKSKKRTSLNNRIGKDIEKFGRSSILAVIGGGKLIRTPHELGYSMDFDYSGVQTTAPTAGSPQPAAPKSRNSQNQPSSNLSIINLCIKGSNCQMQFLHYEKGDDPQIITPNYYSRTNGSSVKINYLIKACSVGWTANVMSSNQNPNTTASALICGAGSAEAAIKSGFEECSKKGNFDCKSASIIQVQWGYWDGTYLADPNPEYEMKLKGAPSSIGGSGGGGCGIYDQNLQSCDKYRAILRSAGIGH